MSLYDPKIYHKFDDKGKEYEIECRKRRFDYYQKMMPFILDYTEGHNIALLQFIWDDKTSDNSRVDIRRNFPPNHPLGKQPIFIMGKEEKFDFMRREKNFSYHPVVFLSKNKNPESFFLLSIAFEPNYRGLFPINKYGHIFGLLDIEVKDINEYEARPFVYNACNVLEKDNEYVVMPVYTGGSWHVWFRKPDFSAIGFFAKKDEVLEDSVNNVIFRVAKDIGLDIQSQVVEQNGRIVHKRHIDGKVNLDFRGGNQPRSYVHCPLALHRKSGLVSIPLRMKEISKINPPIDAHPLTVMEKEKMELYVNRVMEFFVSPKKFELYDPNYITIKKPIKLPEGQSTLQRFFKK